jgi:hypothetical protein
MVTCDFCGTSAPGTASSADRSEGTDTSGGDRSTPDEVPMTWMTSVENGRRRVYCDRCSREHLRAIESKLDSEWW